MPASARNYTSAFCPLHSQISSPLAIVSYILEDNKQYICIKGDFSLIL